MSLSAASAASPSFIATTPTPTPTMSTMNNSNIDCNIRRTVEMDNGDNKSTTQHTHTNTDTNTFEETRRLRSLIQNSLLRNGGSTAVFYASILHAKQEANYAVSAPDTLLYARALVGEFRRAVLLLERKGMLLGRQRHYSNDNIAMMEPCDYIEAALLANHCLSEGGAGEIEDGCVILEEVCRFPFPSKSSIQNCSGSLLQLQQHFPMIESGDDARLMDLAQVICSTSTCSASGGEDV
eukprot:CAMPEP_0116013624 /NCGR_PEP_ID=MMETSP0321-20121206/5830_1 /TAXON_ID=163516 /ORGANISM="Leptocylindrus danicus var. danicus, Strain B650" /LENGTH=237 /DNA_ID=CAMNT_0003483195 /DNA_START=135 /DNA_END=845 /DNA_ORIENTATION=+